MARHLGRSARLPLIAALLALSVLSAASTEAQVPLKFEAVTEPFEAHVSEASFPTFDARGKPLDRTRWRVVAGTGNERENYLASTESGMLLDFGGEWLRFSEDEGRTWSSVLPTEEFMNWWSFEGAVAVAPGGDIVAAGQDALASGVFRAMTFKYEAAVEKWFFSFSESHSPFLDRPAIGVLPGPFQIANETVPYISVLRGGLLAGKGYWTYSLDGLNYGLVNARFVDGMTSLPRTEPLEVEKWSDLDWIQSHDLIGITPLGHGKAMSERPSMGAWDTETHAPRSILDPTTLRWTAYDFSEDGPPKTTVANCADEVEYPDCMESEGRTLADSRGNLHHIVFSFKGHSIVYWFSSDGGEKWHKMVFPLLEGYEAPFNAGLDKSFRVSGARNKTAVVVHAIKSKDPLVTRDLVYEFSFAKGLPRVQKIHVLGSGDYSCFPDFTAADLTAEYSCDFPSITFMPGGRLAVSFTDSKNVEPAIAIELPR